MLAETTYLLTEDGWRLALHRVAARGPQRRHPVLMVHGFACNRHFFNLDERYSLAGAASARGFDVYVLELRGAGMSLPPKDARPPEMTWGFDEYAHIDVPTAIRAVLAASSNVALHGVGHSMGGMLLYAQAVQRPSTLRSVATVASPVVSELNLATTERHLLRLASKLAPQAGKRRLPIRQVFGVAGRFVTMSSVLADGVLLNAANCEPDVVGRMARESINDVPLQLLLEITQQMTSSDRDSGPYAYERLLDRIEVPVLSLSGSVDRVAPPAAVAAVVQRLAARDVRYREMGQGFGCRADYGHGDLLVGSAAPDEVYPALLDFLEEVD